MYEENGMLRKLKMTDVNEVEVVRIDFQNRETETEENEELWQTRDIPEGKEIVGLYANTENDTGCIGSLGFILWNANEFTRYPSDKK